MYSPCFVLSIVFCLVHVSLQKEIPDYIDVCKRDQETIDDCVRKSIEKLRPKLAVGIPELNVPALDPLYVPEIVADSGELINFKAVGRDVKVSGAGNFTIKRVHVDLDTFTIRAHVKFPKLHIIGKYDVDARLLVVPLVGQGKVVADAVKCDAELTFKSKIVEVEGKEYINFTSVDMDINVKDYRVRLDGLFNGDKILEQAANEAINQNKREFLRASKPYLEKTCSKLILQTSNRIASTYPLEDLVPK